MAEGALGDAAAPDEPRKAACKAAGRGARIVKPPRTQRRRMVAGPLAGQREPSARARTEKVGTEQARVTVRAGGDRPITVSVEGSTAALPEVLQQSLEKVIETIASARSDSTTLRDSARGALLDSEERYTPSQLEGQLSIGRRTIDRWRKERRVVAVQVANRFEYPTFQVDAPNRRIRPIVEEVNPLLPAGDEWDVLSWWIQPNASLPPGTRPADLVAGDNADHESLRRLALAAGAHD